MNIGDWTLISPATLIYMFNINLRFSLLISKLPGVYSKTLETMPSLPIQKGNSMATTPKTKPNLTKPRPPLVSPLVKSAMF